MHQSVLFNINKADLYDLRRNRKNNIMLISQCNISIKHNFQNPELLKFKLSQQNIKNFKFLNGLLSVEKLKINKKS